MLAYSLEMALQEGFWCKDQVGRTFLLKIELAFVTGGAGARFCHRCDSRM